MATSDLLTNLLIVVSEGIDGVDLMVKNFSKRKSSSKGAIWIHNEGLKDVLGNLKQLSAVVSHSCVKFALLFSSTCSTVEKSPAKKIEQYSLFDSLITEFQSQVATLVFCYLSSFCQSSVSRCLYDSTSNLLKGLLQNIKELLTIISNTIIASPTSEARNKATYYAGTITKLNEDMQKIPAGNKVAIRRFIMEKCSSVKETVREFQEYVDDHAKLLEKVEVANTEDISSSMEALDINDGIKDNEDDDDDDENMDEDEDEDEDIPYTDEEASYVGTSLLLLAWSLDSMKTALGGITAVADAVYNTKNNTNADTIAVSVTEAPESDTKLNEAPSPSPVCLACDTWVEQVQWLVHDIESNVIDFGAELYPPFWDIINDSVRTRELALKAKVEELLLVLDDDAWRSYQPPAMTETVLRLRAFQSTEVSV